MKTKTFFILCLVSVFGLTQLWLKLQMTGELTSIRNDEVFRIKEITEVDLTDPTLYMGHCNLRGDKGSHYVLIYLIDYFY